MEWYAYIPEGIWGTVNKIFYEQPHILDSESILRNVRGEVTDRIVDDDYRESIIAQII